MYCPSCGAVLTRPADPTLRILTCPGCGVEVDLALFEESAAGRDAPPTVAATAPAALGTPTGAGAPSDELIGREIGGRYRIDSFLGRGGMGTVYRGTQLSLARQVALKVLSPELTTDEHFVRRFRREAGALAAFNHPHIVTIYDSGEEEGLHYIVMAYVEGPAGEPLSLRDLIAQGPLEEERALRVMSQVCAGLEYAHERGIIHRDIKPGNILLDGQGGAHLADFGIARVTGGAEFEPTLTAPGTSIGTLRYMAPEQKEDAARADMRSDLYSLGVVFYEMLTGQLPEGRFELPGELRAGLHPRIDAMVEHTLRRAVDKRTQSAAELREEVEAVLTEREYGRLHGGAQAPPPPPTPAAGAAPAAATPGWPRPNWSELRSGRFWRVWGSPEQWAELRRARPWMFWGPIIGAVVVLIAIAIESDIGDGSSSGRRGAVGPGGSIGLAPEKVIDTLAAKIASQQDIEQADIEKLARSSGLSPATASLIDTAGARKAVETLLSAVGNGRPQQAAQMAPQALLARIAKQSGDNPAGVRGNLGAAYGQSAMFLDVRATSLGKPMPLGSDVVAFPVTFRPRFADPKIPTQGTALAIREGGRWKAIIF